MNPVMAVDADLDPAIGSIGQDLRRAGMVGADDEGLATAEHRGADDPHRARSTSTLRAYPWGCTNVSAMLSAGSGVRGA